ncbi:glycosyltransferase family 4 protein [Frankia sp. EAN1pec]|uniref:glycosyltransferase n=1 Tax=Parafrankia sp. (strain EAN1pec) TaxID=298653 RepID=UPI0012FACED5
MAQPLRVLYSFPHPLGLPGIGTTAYHQVISLWRQGIEVQVYCTSVARPLPPGLPVRQTMALGGQRLPPRAVGVKRARYWHDRVVATALAREYFDVAHVWPGAAVHTLRACRRLGIPGLREAPNTHTAHACDVVARETARLGLTMQRNSSHAPNPRSLRLEDAEYGAATALLVPSDVAAETFVGRGMPAGRLVRHRYGFDPRTFPAPRAEEMERPGTRPLHVVFVGRCEPRKGLHLLLEAWRRSGLAGRARLTICGSFWSSYRALLAPALAQPGVETPGFVTDVPGLLRSADVLALPSLEEGSALVTYEAQASGCALLVSRQSGAVLTHGEQGLLHEAGDVDTLAAHLRQLEHDRSLLERLRCRALAARKSLTWNHAGTILHAAYERSRAAAVDGAGTDAA